MNFKPLHDRVLIRPEHPIEQTTAGGIILPDNAKRATLEGDVLRIGEGAPVEGKFSKRPLIVKEGQRVLFEVFCGKPVGAPVTIDGDDLIVVHEDQLLGILED